MMNSLTRKTVALSILLGILAQNNFIAMEQKAKGKELALEQSTKETSTLRRSGRKRPLSSLVSTEEQSSSSSTSQEPTKENIEKALNKFFEEYDATRIRFVNDISPAALRKIQQITNRRKKLVTTDKEHLKSLLGQYRASGLSLDDLGTSNMGIAHRSILAENPEVLELVLQVQPDLLTSRSHPHKLTPLQLVLSRQLGTTILPVRLQLLNAILNAAIANHSLARILAETDNETLNTLVQEVEKETLKTIINELLHNGSGLLSLVLRLRPANFARIKSILNSTQALIVPTPVEHILAEPSNTTTTSTSSSNTASLARRLPDTPLTHTQTRLIGGLSSSS